MKFSSKLFAFLFLLFSYCSSAFAQVQVAPFTDAYSQFSQMWNTSSVYYNTPYWTDAKHTNLGTQLDTTSGTTVLNLYTAILTRGISNVDTFLPTPIIGYGQINLSASVLKVTGTDTIVVTPVGSLDGIHWHAIQGLTPASLTPTSLTIPVGVEWCLGLYGSVIGGKQDRYYGLSFKGQTGTTTSVQGWFYFQNPVIINK